LPIKNQHLAKFQTKKAYLDGPLSDKAIQRARDTRRNCSLRQRVDARNAIVQCVEKVCNSLLELVGTCLRKRQTHLHKLDSGLMYVGNASVEEG